MSLQEDQDGRKTPCGQDFAENIKHKVWLRVGLEDLEIVKRSANSQTNCRQEKVEEDLSTVTQMAELAGKLPCHHQDMSLNSARKGR
ncbi:hypothetical protein RRG08_060440 [Elysia crispata]|uniref:Uncharacterized protein n=1 Tax=Elysia crispata TaxID=231223 RepID=A0AAE1E0U9_9GAST|nr:hypothetical protein RRG08_060440 [Elysia crispata]